MLTLGFLILHGMYNKSNFFFASLGNAQGKDQKHGILGKDIPYINRPLWNGEPLKFVVPKAKSSKRGDYFFFWCICFPFV